MRFMTFGPDYSQVEIAILIKNSGLRQTELRTNYVEPICPNPSDQAHFMAANLAYPQGSKCNKAYIKTYLDDLLSELQSHGIKLLIVADSNYFKVLADVGKVDKYYGYILQCKYPGYGHMKVMLIPNYFATMFNPQIQHKMKLSLDAVRSLLSNTYQDPGLSIIKSAFYPSRPSDIARSLARLRREPELTCDIEGLSLKFWTSGISTITFCTDEHNGVAFPVDRSSDPKTVRKLLLNFFLTYRGKLTFHNAGFDMKILIFSLFMKDFMDYSGMLLGIETMTRSFDDSKIIAFLATNNAVENVLKLKSLALEFAGNYAIDSEEMKDTSAVPLPELLQYNLVDGLSTWFVKKKFWPIMVQDGQLDIYETMFKPAVKQILQMELVGMPIDPVRVQEVKAQLLAIQNTHMDGLTNSKVMQEFVYVQKEKLAAEKTAAAKKKVYTINDPVVARYTFNPASDKQTRTLLYEHLGLPIIDRTKTKQGSTKSKTFKALRNHTQNQDTIDILDNLIGLADVEILLTTFIPAFERAVQLPDGSWRLFGNFNICGTQSGRLSSSDPNLQNIPAGSKFGKLIKSCFISPPGWLFVGADFRALEAMGNALQTQDPNKLKVYTDGFDSHCLNAFAYFRKLMPDIDETVQSINSIKDKYPALRNKSKPPTFALQYEGVPATLVRSLGIPLAEAEEIYDNFHKLYVVSDQWADKLIATASSQGFIDCAFGLRLRTPTLAATVLGTKATPYEAQEERRSVLNAKTQSLGLLNTRAGIEFQERCLASPYRLDIMPCAQIHDAAYFLIREDIAVVEFTNNNLIECMEWQQLDELQHPTIRLGAELDIYWPTWATPLQIPNWADPITIKSMCLAHAGVINGQGNFQHQSKP